MRVPTLLPEPSVERLDESVIRGLPRTTEVQLHPVQVGPLVQAFRSALRAVIHPDGLGQPALLHAPEITPSAATVSTRVCSKPIPRWDVHFGILKTTERILLVLTSPFGPN